MESTDAMTYDYFHYLNSSTDNITYDMYLDEYEDLLKFFSLTRILIPVIFGLITCLGLFGNILTIVVILLKRTNKGITKYLILNMAVADLLYVAFCVPFKAIYPALGIWPFGDIWCRIHAYLEYVSYFASMYILVLVSLDRYIALVHPIRAIRLRTKRNGYMALVVLWSLVILGNIPFLFTAKVNNLSSEQANEQTLVCIPYDGNDFIFTLCLFTFDYILPLILLFGLYGHMLAVFLTGKSPSEHSSRDHVRLQARKRVTKMVILVVTVFMVCWTPLQIILFYTSLSPHVRSTVTFASVVYAVQCLAYMNSCINPILYTFYTHSFRNGILDVVCCRQNIYRKRGSYSSAKRGSVKSTLSTSSMM